MPKSSPFAAAIGARAFACDATRREDVEALFVAVADAYGPPDIVVYNPSGRARGAIVDLDPDAVLNALLVSCYGGFLVAQQAARAMLARGRGTILFTGASASVKGFAISAPFAMGKFGLRGLAQSMARELAPRTSMSRISSSMAASAGRRCARLPARPGRHARARRHRVQLSPRASPAPQRLELGDRAPPLGRDLLTALTRWAVLWRALSARGAVRPDDDHMRDAVTWLLGAQRAAGGTGFAHSFHILRGWLPPYPETTGYILPSLRRVRERYAIAGLDDAIAAAARWLDAVQQPPTVASSTCRVASRSSIPDNSPWLERAPAIPS